MPSYLDFDSTKKFRDVILGKTLQVPNGPQTQTKDTYTFQKLSNLSNVDPGAVDDNRKDELKQTSNSNIYKPTNFFIEENLRVLPRRANLNLYPYFTKGNHNLVSIMSTSNYDTESELQKFASSYIRDKDAKGPVYSRIQRNTETATNGRLRLLDALDGNTATAFNIVTGREPLVAPNYKITVDNKINIEQGIDLLQTVAGIQLPFSEIPGDYLSNPANPINYRPTASTEVGKLYQDVTGALGSLIGIQRRPKLSRKPSDLLIEYMGSGSRGRLFDMLTFSKYAPNYTTSARSQQSSKIFNFVDNAAQSVKTLLGIEAPAGVAYIGDDRGNDVKYAMSDFNDRPVRSSYYLSLMFDQTAAELFHITKNLTEGGKIGGNLTWYSKNSKNKLGTGNKEWNSEKAQLEESLSTKYGFREDSILGYTQEILDSMPSDGGAARSHVANVIDQTSRVFGEGDLMISRGSAIKYTDKFSGTESGIEYCRVWTKDRGYMNYSDTMKRTANVRKFDGSVMGGTSRVWNLNMGPMSNGNKSFEGSTNIFEKTKGSGDFYAKKYMFSLENLAWKTSTTEGFTYNDLPAIEKGPNGGRVMWFPPYGLKITDNNSAKWEPNTFLGRPEPIYTYQNSERTGTLNFKIVVDHPSILNLLVREHFKNMSDEEADNYINAFFAGCQDLDFYDLIQTYTMLDSNDVTLIIDYLNRGKGKDVIRKYKFDVPPSVENTPIQPDGGVTYKPIEPITATLLFENDRPSPTDSKTPTSSTSYDTLYSDFIKNKDNNISKLTNALSALTGNTPTAAVKNDRDLIFGGQSPTSTNVNEKVTRVSKGYDDLTAGYNKIKAGLTQLKKDISGKTTNHVEISIYASTSEVAAVKYNFYLGMRRANSIVKDIFNQISNSKVPAIVWPKSSDLVKYEKSGLPVGSTTYSFRDFGYDTDGEIVLKISTDGELAKLSNAGGIQVDCGKQVYKSSSTLQIVAPNAFFCRQANVSINYSRAETSTPQKVTLKVPPVKVIPDDTPIPGAKPKPMIDVYKRIIMKTLSEGYYFKKLEEDSPLAFKSLTEKLKYFHPGFHSTTPEGLNSRLTFLLQCLRPGDTIPVKGMAENTDIGARNTTFGPPPICILRIGDFYHSKVVISDVNISYEDTTWDLNPEGIGVQPMIADVTVQLKFIGGQGLEKPVERLQNALSSNFFANTEIYDERSISTTTTIDNKDPEKFEKAYLEDLLVRYKTYSNTIDNTNKDNGNEVSEGFIGTISTNQDGTSEVAYDTIINDLSTSVSQYFDTYVSTYQNVTTKYGLSLSSLLLSSKYRTVKDLEIQNGGGSEDIEILGQYPINKDVTSLGRGLKSALDAALSATDVTTMIFGRKVPSDLNSNSETVLKPFIKNFLISTVDDMIADPNVKILESARNKMISSFDNVNYIVQYEQDGSIKDDKYSKLTFDGFTNESFYGNYSQLVNYIKKQNSDFSDDLDTSTVDYNSPVISDSTLELFLSILLKDKKSEVMGLYTDSIFNEYVDKMTKKFDDFITTQKEKNFHLGKFPTVNLDVLVKYPVTIEEMTSGKEDLLKLKSTKNKLDSKLNYYRP